MPKQFGRRITTSLENMTTPRLPVLRGGEADHPDWRRYITWVYGEDVPIGTEVDLNSFSWFYLNSPLARELQPVEHSMARTQLALNTAWTCSLPFKPECVFAPYGFFVSREPLEATVEAWTKTGRLEVTRVKFDETGAAWFYHAVGSGIFLNLDALPTAGQTMVSLGVPPGLGLWDAGIGTYMKERDCNLLIIVDRFPDRRVEVVVRAASLDLPLDSSCPLPLSVFSTGLSTQQPCACSESVTLLNCRRDVTSFLKGCKASLWTDFLFRIVFYLLATVALVGCIVALMLQARMAR